MPKKETWEWLARIAVDAFDIDLLRFQQQLLSSLSRSQSGRDLARWAKTHPIEYGLFIRSLSLLIKNKARELDDKSLLTRVVAEQIRYIPAEIDRLIFTGTYNHFRTLHPNDDADIFSYGDEDMINWNMLSARVIFSAYISAYAQVAFARILLDLMTELDPETASQESIEDMINLEFNPQLSKSMFNSKMLPRIPLMEKNLGIRFRDDDLDKLRRIWMFAMEMMPDLLESSLSSDQALDPMKLGDSFTQAIEANLIKHIHPI